MNATTAFLRGRVGLQQPRVGIVLGSGLGGLADAVEVLIGQDFDEDVIAAAKIHAERLDVDDFHK